MVDTFFYSSSHWTCCALPSLVLNFKVFKGPNGGQDHAHILSLLSYPGCSKPHQPGLSVAKCQWSHSQLNASWLLWY